MNIFQTFKLDDNIFLKTNNKNMMTYHKRNEQKQKYRVLLRLGLLDPEHGCG